MASANDPKALGPAPISSPILDGNGKMSFPWSRWFQVLYQRVGGGSADPVDTLSQKVDALTTRVTNLETHVGTIDGEITSLDTRTTALEAGIAGLNTRVSAIEGLLSSGFSGTITTAQLTSFGSQGSMTFQQGILVSQTQAT